MSSACASSIRCMRISWRQDIYISVFWIGLCRCTRRLSNASCHASKYKKKKKEEMKGSWKSERNEVKANRVKWQRGKLNWKLKPGPEGGGREKVWRGRGCHQVATVDSFDKQTDGRQKHCKNVDYSQRRKTSHRNRSKYTPKKKPSNPILDLKNNRFPKLYPFSPYP